MAVKIEARYLGNKRVELTHLDSGAKIQTTAPKDNQGDGNGFSPTDLVAASLAACMLTIMGIMAEKQAIDIGGAHAAVEKHMAIEGPRRIARLPLVIHLPARLTTDERGRLEAAARTCPVRHSLLESIEAEPQFVYDV